MEITIEQRRPKKQKSFWFTNRSLERKRELRYPWELEEEESTSSVMWSCCNEQLPLFLYCEQGNFQMIYYRNIILNFPTLKNVYTGDEYTESADEEP